MSSAGYVRAPLTPSPPTWTAAVGAALATRVARRTRLLARSAYWAANAGALQTAQLRRLLTRAQDTEFGREHGFARLAVITDDADLWRAYRAAVPIRDWYGFKDRIARMREGGEPGVLWPGLVRDFAQTSGTTAGDKFIPLTGEMMRSNYLASLDIFGYMRSWGVSISRLMSGRCLFLGGSSSVTENEHGVRTGDLSGLVTPLIRWPLTHIYSPGPEIALMDDWPAKIEAMSDLCLGQDVRMISGMPSWATVLMARMLEKAKERRAAGKPVRPEGSSLPEPRAVERVADLWPNLSVFVHGGVKYQPFLPRVNELIYGDPNIDIPRRLELYPASEAFVALQDEPAKGGEQVPLRLNTDLGNAVEFIPLEEIDDDTPRAFAVSDVEPGVRYVVVLTTCAGLYRYVLGDVVVFDTVPPAGPPRLRIVGRHRHFINAFGENIIVEHIENAVEAAVAQSGVAAGEFTAGPVYPGEGRRAGLELVIEMGNPPADLSAFAAAFDGAIKRQNVDYTTKRGSDVGMAPPTVSVVPPGAFHAWMASRGKLGGQHKCPRCANHRDFVEGVLSVL